MAAMDLRKVKQAYQAANPVDAQLVVDLLASEEISAFTQGQYLSGAVGELPAGELLRVWVPDEDVERARAVIAGRDAQAPLLDDAIDPSLARSWSRAWPGLGASGDGVALRDPLLAAWSEPQRRYHTLRHLSECLALFEASSHLAAHPAEVEIALWFHDAEPERFDEYEVQVRQEYAWIPGPLFRRKRREILQGFLARTDIYSTDWFRERFEATARTNLQRSVVRLKPWLGVW